MDNDTANFIASCGWAFVGFGGGGTMSFLPFLKPNMSIGLRRAIFIFCLLCVAFGFAMLKDPTILSIFFKNHIDPIFGSIYKKDALKLGFSKDDSVRVAEGGSFYQGFYDKAVVIWIYKLGNVLAIHNNYQDFYISAPDIEPYPAKQWYSESFVKTRLSLRCKPPIGELAKHWYEEKEKFSWIGCNLTDYIMSGKNLRIQRFAGGLIIGPVLATEEAGAGKNLGRLYAINNDGTWVDENYDGPDNPEIIGKPR